MTFWERLIAKLEPWVTPDFEIYCRAIGAMFEPLEELAAEEGEDGTPGYVPPYGKLLNPSTCPAKYLPYLGQFVGVTVPEGTPELEARKLIKAEAGLERGTPKALEAAIRRTLAGAEPSFPSLTATDSFARANEKPLSNGGKWAAPGTVQPG